MTDKLKCCFCGSELDIMKGISDSVLGCPKCKHIATIGVWEVLIAGEKARHALKGIKQTLDECFSSDKSGFIVFWDVIARRVHSVITDSTKQGE